jgi:hypothetical protein
MASTPLYALPAPDHPEDADGPEQLLALAAAVEALLSTGTLKMSTGVIEAADPTSARHPVTKGWFDARIMSGPVASLPATLPPGAIYAGY